MSTIPGFTKMKYPGPSCEWIKLCHRCPVDILSLALCKAAQHGHLSAKMAPLSLEIGHTSREIITKWCFQWFFMFTSKIGEMIQIWRALFWNGLVQPASSGRWIQSYRCNLMWITKNFPMRGTGRVMRFQTKRTLSQKLGLRWKWFGIQMVILKTHTEWYIPCWKYPPSQPLSDQRATVFEGFQVSLSQSAASPADQANSSCQKHGTKNDAIKPPSGHRTQCLALTLVKYGKFVHWHVYVWSMKIFQQLLTSMFL